MAGIRISALPELEHLSDDDLFVVVEQHSNITKHIKKINFNLGQISVGSPSSGDYSGGYITISTGDYGSNVIQSFNIALNSIGSSSHQQNTDIGTTSDRFILGVSRSTNVLLKEEFGSLVIRNFVDNEYMNVTASNALFNDVNTSHIYSTGYNTLVGPNTFGSQITDKHMFTGSVNITGSLSAGAISTVYLNPTQIAYGNHAGVIVGSDSVTYDGTDLTIIGGLQASYKSFKIPHPTKPGKMLVYGSLEGPEHCVYIRGVSKSEVLYLPEYWTKLVDESTITVQITPIGGFQSIYVEKIQNNAVYLKQTVYSKILGMITKTPFNYFYTAFKP
ncbi:MAG: hypothetical protein WCO84_06690 [bacterium]